MTTVDDRFQVTCSCCGFLSGHKTFQDAKLSAVLAERRHFQPYELIEIFDIMAHIGNPDTWTANGLVVRYRSA